MTGSRGEKETRYCSYNVDFAPNIYMIRQYLSRLYNLLDIYNLTVMKFAQPNYPRGQLKYATSRFPNTPLPVYNLYSD